MGTAAVGVVITGAAVGGGGVVITGGGVVGRPASGYAGGACRFPLGSPTLGGGGGGVVSTGGGGA